jgi:hypothetical protein
MSPRPHTQFVGQSRKGLRIHRARDLTGQTTTHDGIPVTTPARTILDLAATLQRRPLERLLDQAENTRLTDVPSLEALARAHAGHRGASQLLQTLDAHEPGTTLTRSVLEELFLALCHDHGLPRPAVNAAVVGPEVDFVFTEQRVLVETDSWRWHKTRDAFERDRQRDALHARAGYRTLRFTHLQLTSEPQTVAATLRAALSGYARPMTEEHTGGAADQEREMREHEREARERDADERNPETAGLAEPGDDENPAPPGNIQTGEVSGGS